jgi:hypothetical protein
MSLLWALYLRVVIPVFAVAGAPVVPLRQRGLTSQTSDMSGTFPTNHHGLGPYGQSTKGATSTRDAATKKLSGWIRTKTAAASSPTSALILYPLS